VWSIDLYQLRRIDPKVPLADQVGELLLLQREGKIRHIDLSEVTVEQIEEARKIADIVSVRNLYNLANRGAEDVLEYASGRTWASSRGSRSPPANWRDRVARWTLSPRS
jgi:aryl-alcohol dehydrogenase-like predicted oxidoreductase